MHKMPHNTLNDGHVILKHGRASALWHPLQSSPVALYTEQRMAVCLAERTAVIVAVQLLVRITYLLSATLQKVRNAVGFATVRELVYVCQSVYHTS